MQPLPPAAELPLPNRMSWKATSASPIGSDVRWLTRVGILPPETRSLRLRVPFPAGVKAFWALGRAAHPPVSSACRKPIGVLSCADADWPEGREYS